MLNNKHHLFKDRKGEKFTSKHGEVEIIDYINNGDCTIKFEDGTIIFGIAYNNVLKDKIRNPNKPTFFDIGFIGLGDYKTFESLRVKTKSYKSWYGILKRCYDGNNPTYNNAEICKEWANFQNFAKWHEENYRHWMDNKWHLDKDILVKGNKIYSPETCCFIPQEINMQFAKANAIRGEYPIGVNYSKTNRKFIATYNKENKKIYLGSFNTPEEAFQAYKTAKEAYIKELADKYKNQINKNVYNALYKYEVEITD